MNQVFAHCSKNNEIYPLAIMEIAEAHKRDQNLKKFFRPKTIITKKGYGFHLIKNMKELCKDGKMINSPGLQHWAVSWYHHGLRKL